MNFKKYFNLILTVFVCCNRVRCTTKVDIPMVDTMDAPLKASFDISVLNQVIKDIIKEEVKHGIEQAMDEKAEKIAERKLNESIDILNSRLSNTVAVLRNESTPVSLSSCTSKDTDLKAGDIFKFDRTVMSVGVAEPQSFASTGTFICPLKGVYLVSATIISKFNAGQFAIYKNGVINMRAYIGTSAEGRFFPSTIVTTVELDASDKVHLESRNNIFMRAPYSCISLIKLG